MATEWMDEGALCTQTGPDAFHPEGTPSRTALRVCAACPVRAECLAYALGDETLGGIWGGTTQQQRNRLRLIKA